MITIEQVREKSRRQKAEMLQHAAEARIQALARGKEDLDLGALERLRTRQPGSPETPDELAYLYFVTMPRHTTMAEFAKTLDKLAMWSDGPGKRRRSDHAAAAAVRWAGAFSGEGEPIARVGAATTLGMADPAAAVAELAHLANDSFSQEPVRVMALGTLARLTAIYDIAVPELAATVADDRIIATAIALGLPESLTAVASQLADGAGTCAVRRKISGRLMAAGVRGPHVARLLAAVRGPQVAPLAAAVALVGRRLGVNVSTLVAAVGELGAPAVDTRIGWWSASDRVMASAAWPTDDAAVRRRIADPANRTQRITVPILRARHGESWIAYESVPRWPRMIATAVGVPGRCDPAHELAAFVGPSIVRTEASRQLADAWARLGIACDLFVDRALPRLGPNFWTAWGSMPSAELPHAVEGLQRTIPFLARQRALVEPVGATGPTVRVGLDTVFDGVHPAVWIATGPIGMTAARSLLAGTLGDDARAAKVLDALAEAGTANVEVAVRLATDDPLWVRVVGAIGA